MSAEIEDDMWKFKIILAGAGAVGKTTLMNRFVRGTFAGEYKATIGVDILTKEIIYNKENKTHQIKLQIWDIAGQELFRSFRKRFFSNARGCLLIFDLTVPQTLKELHTWVSDIYEIAGSIPIILIGNKVDLTINNLQRLYVKNGTFSTGINGTNVNGVGSAYPLGWRDASNREGNLAMTQRSIFLNTSGYVMVEHQGEDDGDGARPHAGPSPAARVRPASAETDQPLGALRWHPRREGRPGGGRPGVGATDRARSRAGTDVA